MVVQKDIPIGERTAHDVVDREEFILESDVSGPVGRKVGYEEEVGE